MITIHTLYGVFRADDAVTKAIEHRRKLVRKALRLASTYPKKSTERAAFRREAARLAAQPLSAIAGLLGVRFGR